MLLKDLSFKSPEENILYDDVLLHLAEQGQGGEVLRFWESQQLFVVLGRICKIKDDVNEEEVKKDNISVLRRSSGGGTVLQGKGCLNYTLILSKDNPDIADLRKSYQLILNKVIAVLKNLGVEVSFLPISDIALTKNQKKISGNAQKRGRKFILHHGTLLYNFDLNKIEKYLKMPKNVPEYRQKRAHLEFIDNTNLPVNKIKDLLKKEFCIVGEEGFLRQEERECLDEFLKEGEIIEALD